MGLCGGWVGETHSAAGSGAFFGGSMGFCWGEVWGGGDSVCVGWGWGSGGGAAVPCGRCMYEGVEEAVRCPLVSWPASPVHPATPACTHPRARTHTPFHRRRASRTPTLSLSLGLSRSLLVSRSLTHSYTLHLSYPKGAAGLGRARRICFLARLIPLMTNHLSAFH